ncbi:hypothetical protein PROFUN_14353 [Planoprotostelium fungivorum]|uniref:NAD(P)-binding domain-containing protein n=1 Tax=Planoprotostelium fungivorum TaxID=1890364 RepID=A0A2P6N016_9EUKA|nr:hypothetical protein PROFUN_14353 [Planoprotostelium fungivorum]
MAAEGISAIVMGGSGAVGKELLASLIRSPRYKSITSIGRRQIDLDDSSSKVKQVVVDVSKLSEHKDVFNSHDVAFCTFGTTRKDAGSAAAFQRIDRDYVLDFARLAKEAGIKNMHYVSSMGANKNSWFLYPKTKGEIEESLKEMEFDRLIIYRPGFLNRGGAARTVEKIAQFVMPSIPVSVVGAAICHLGQKITIDGTEVITITNEGIQEAAKKETEDKQ